MTTKKIWAVQKAKEPKLAAERRSAKAIQSPLDRLVPGTPIYHYDALRHLAPKVAATAEKLSLNRAVGKELELPSEELLHGVLSALGQFRSISKRGPHATLITLAREADRMWERLRLCENIGRLAAELGACAMESPMEKLEKKDQQSGFERRSLRQRLRALLRQPATAKATDLEMLMPLLPERYREQIEIIRSDDPRKNSRSDEVRTALARLCAELLRDQNAECLARARLLRPAFDFFLALNDRGLFRKAGFISEAEDQEITAYRRSKRAQNTQERQERCRSKKKARTQA